MLVLIFSTVAIIGQRNAIYEKFAGTYVTGHEWGGGSITLNDDGTFSDSGGSDDGTIISTSGTYSLSEGWLVCSIKKRTISRGGDRTYNLLDPTDLKDWNYGRATEIEREFKFLSVEWSGRIYLISESDTKNFAQAINLGIEPRPWLGSDSVVSPWFGSFLLRRGDQKKRVVGIPSLPKELKAFVLKRPVIATVIKIVSRVQQKYGLESTVIINKGTRDGLKPGMRLVAKNEVPSLGTGTEVISVDRTTATIKTTVYPALKMGDRLSSHYEPSPILKRMRTFEMQEREKSENLK